MNNQDIFALSVPETHRVVSISASQSLHASSASADAGAISTGLPRLDEAICPTSLDEFPGLISDPSSTGLPRGQITEVFGPPGVGKTSLALSAASNALRDGGKVVWIDTCSPLPRLRLKKMLLKSMESEENPSLDDLAQNLIYFRAQSLPHLMALLLRPPKGFPPEDTTLLVIDSVSGPFPSYFPNPAELKSRLAQLKITEKSQVQWLMSRRWDVTSDLANQLVKLATAHRMAVLLINQTHTKIKGQPRATLCPVLAGGSWENSIYTRIAMYRDFPDIDDNDTVDTSITRKPRFAEVMRRTGKALTLRLDENIIPFVIESDGLSEIASTQPSCTVTQKTDEASNPASQRKRKVDEIADSQDEDSDEEFGWIEGDDADLLGGNSHKDP
ncbi:hypothetical protein ASPWEDRAFT_290969 [Aspergillus wentii DTO 134E9]|uniref:DNA repair protein RAD51 homolog 3 n=1 Tax=Aspergillus wentii DTO 134E9 TaxID=1073089 RepID=A0A1L9S443_ASPWE|nr:uncharacterized protein ASPWEDRAFT_290969 [Aspergillus wentii DTO 134E9]OJJ41884.1 hypothetical protein ASPWEDRAFT_290969 [Aspergillus wentii DTO 134E9]